MAVLCSIDMTSCPKRWITCATSRRRCRPSSCSSIVAAATWSASGRCGDAGWCSARGRRLVVSPGDHRLGAHLDRLLRAAEHEATEIREVAERRAAALLTEAHAEIARHEQDRRRAWQEREAALVAAEQRSADELAAARDQAASW